jgi:hypothetical protein
MLAGAVALWVLGLFTAVPYAAYHLLYYAPREQYALLMTFVLFWIFGYWGVVGPLLAIVKVRRVFRALESAKSKDDLTKALQSAETRDVAIDLIAADNHIPRFLARRVYGLLIAKGAEIAEKGITQRTPRGREQGTR